MSISFVMDMAEGEPGVLLSGSDEEWGIEVHTAISADWIKRLLDDNGIEYNVYYADPMGKRSLFTNLIFEGL